MHVSVFQISFQEIVLVAAMYLSVLVVFHASEQLVFQPYLEIWGFDSIVARILVSS